MPVASSGFSRHQHLRRWRMPDKLVHPLNEILHVRRVGVAAVVLPPRKLPVQQSLVHCRRLRRMLILECESLGAKQSIDAARVDGSHETTLVVKPPRIAFLRYSVADKGKPRGAQCNQFIRIHWNLARTPASETRLSGGILHEIPSHPEDLPAGEPPPRPPEIGAKRSASALSR